MAYLKLLRPLNCMMAGIAVLIGASIALGPLSWDVALAFLATFLICGAGNAINDYFDIEIDRINRPARPLPSGEISLQTAYYYSLILFAIGILVSIFINIYALLLAFFNSILLYIYAWKIKKGGGITKNFTVSYLVASPFVFGGLAVVGNILPTLLLALLAFIVNTSREIAKDMEDFVGDRKYIRTLPSEIGLKSSSEIAAILVIIALLISPLPYLLGFLNTVYLALVTIADAIFLYSTIKFLRDLSPTSFQKNIKIGMLTALVSFFIGSL
jgi:geranylgeranylglycerol-phosphate geranylgeranyltransferase